MSLINRCEAGVIKLLKSDQIDEIPYTCTTWWAKDEYNTSAQAPRFIHWTNKTLSSKTIHRQLLAALRNQRLATSSLFWIVLAESHWTYGSANLDSTPHKTSYSWRNDRMRMSSSWGTVFLGRPLRGLSLMERGLLFVECARMMPQLLWKQQLEVTLSHSPDPHPDHSNVACWFLEQTPTDHWSRTLTGANQRRSGKSFIVATYSGLFLSSVAAFKRERSIVTKKK